MKNAQTNNSSYWAATRCRPAGVRASAPAQKTSSTEPVYVAETTLCQERFTTMQGYSSTAKLGGSKAKKKQNNAH